MNKAIILGTSIVALGLVAFAWAQRQPDGDTLSVPSPETSNSQSRQAVDLTDEEKALVEALGLDPEEYAEELAREQEYLRSTLGENPDQAPDLQQQAEGENVPFRQCQKTAGMKRNLADPGKTGHRAYRDIWGYLSKLNVVETKDCSCATKIIDDETVEAFAQHMRDELGVDVLLPEHTLELSQEEDRLRTQAIEICGEF